MGNVFFTSDLHFGHGKVSDIRGFDTTDDHDNAIIDNWNSAIGKEDQVWVLGDICAGGKSAYYRALDIVGNELNGTKHLITGNHDLAFPGHRDSHKYQRDTLGAFDSVQPFARRRIDGRQVLLSHFPYEHDRGVPRYTQYRLKDEGLYLLHGHTHEGVIGTAERPREIHVGLDAWDLHPAHIMDALGVMEFLEELAALPWPHPPATFPL